MAWSRADSQPQALVPIGAVLPFAGIAVPSGWIGCDGSAISRTTYDSLFRAITLTRSFATTNASTSVTTGDTSSIQAGMFVEGTGIPSGATVSSVTNATTFVLSANATATGTATLRFYAYGRGDGASTFNVPDLRGRMPMGAGTGTGNQNTSSTLSGLGTPTGGSAMTSRIVGQWGGQEQHQLTTTTMPSHTHTQNEHGHSMTGQSFNGPVGAGYVMGSNGGSGLGGPWAQFGVANATATNQNTGGGQAHNIINPFVVTHYIIRAS